MIRIALVKGRASYCPLRGSPCSVEQVEASLYIPTRTKFQLAPRSKHFPPCRARRASIENRPRLGRAGRGSRIIAPLVLSNVERERAGWGCSHAMEAHRRALIIHRALLPVCPSARLPELPAPVWLAADCYRGGDAGADVYDPELICLGADDEVVAVRGPAWGADAAVAE